MSAHDISGEFLQVLADLQRQPPRIAPRYFYDAEGSSLFDRITRTPEYYLTRAELGILRKQGARIASLIAPGACVVELGSGSADKVLTLLDHLRAPLLYRPIDISWRALQQTIEALKQERPSLRVSSYWGDFTAEGAYGDLPSGAPRLVYYSGSTIGNFEPKDQARFLSALRSRLASGDAMLLAVDLVKEPSIIEAAYDDAEGATAAFNRNVLAHLNARFQGNFDVTLFEHRAFYDVRLRRVEMHLVPRQELVVTLGGVELSFGPQRSIHTENSYKFTLDDLNGLAHRSGFVLEDVLMDEQKWFAEALLRVP